MEEKTKAIVNHYRYDCDGSEFSNLIEEALVSFEQWADLRVSDDKLIGELAHHIRIECLLYLALKESQTKLSKAESIIKEAKEYIKNHCSVYEQDEDYDYEENLELNYYISTMPSELLDILGKE